MKIVEIDLNSIKAYENNPRLNDAAVDPVAESIKAFGFKVPIVVDSNNVIVTGHTRAKAAQKIGLKKVPCIIASDLTEEQIKKFRLVDNKVAEIADWDEDLLTLELAELEGMADFGFDEFDLENQEEYEGLTDEDAIPEDVEPVCKLGQIWKLGEHRVMCGDSTKKEDVEKLMEGKKADMVFTDPPYNIDYEGVRDKKGKIKNDNMGDKEFLSFLEHSLSTACETLYVCCSWNVSAIFMKAMENIGKKVKAFIVWNKVNPAQHLDKYYKQHEIILYSGKFGGQKTIRGDVWEIKRERNTLHPTMKPVELISIALNDNPDRIIIYDGFLGSGSTLIACEKTNRVCYGMELYPHYCDVIINRWEQFTGKKAELILDK